MIKVCFIISGIDYSGAEIVLNRYLKNNQDVDAHFIIIYDNKYVIEKLKEKYNGKNIHELGLKINKFTLNFLPGLEIKLIENKMKSIMDQINPQVIYANNTIESMLISKYISNTHIKSIAHVHDMKSSFKSIIKRKFIVNSLKKYDEIIMVSEATKNSWKGIRSNVIYNGMDDEYFEPNHKEYSLIKNIGFVGSLSKRKGIDILIGSIPKLLSLGYTINIATRDKDGKYAKRLNKLKNDNINIYYNLEENQIKRFMNNMDVLIVPSREDPLPTVIMEAMATGTIVIGNNIESIKEMILDERLLYNNKRIIDRLNYLGNMNTEELERISIKLKLRCNKVFSNVQKRKNVNSIIKKIIMEN
ncbi:glycosyltransferase family 4 protein [Clostridium beijerinckii]|uniref:glycosyltransferase family 4 protein n=1 Tax=Clostridium beijerinckii TaxID=1520 RepID=UPI00232DD022|nr:glycosyltransferase family 4 protein [Clostridium beijerinckii]